MGNQCCQGRDKEKQASTDYNYDNNNEISAIRQEECPSWKETNTLEALVNQSNEITSLTYLKNTNRSSKEVNKETESSQKTDNSPQNQEPENELETQKSSSNANLDPINNPTTETISVKPSQSTSGKIWLKSFQKEKMLLNISIIKLIVSAKNLRWFGIYFSPYLSVYIGNNKWYTISPEEEPEDKDDSNNVSSTSWFNQSANNLSWLSSSKISNTIKNKEYTFDFNEDITLSSKDYYSNLNIVLKNNLPLHDKISEVVIGKVEWKINTIPMNNFENILSWEYWASTIVGELQIKVSLSNNNDKEDNYEDFSNKDLMSMRSEVGDNVGNKNKEMNTEWNIINCLSREEFMTINTNFICDKHNNITSSYTLLGYDEQSADLVIRLKKDFITAINKNEDWIQLYQILGCWNNLIAKGEDYRVHEFFTSIENVNEVWIHCYNKIKNSQCSLTLLVNLLWKYLYYSRESRDIKVRKSIVLKDSTVFDIAFTIIQNMNYDNINDSLVNVILRVLGIVYEVISETYWIGNISDEQQEEIKKKWFIDSIQGLSQKIISNQYRSKWVRLAVTFSQFSDIICWIMKILRKCLLSVWSQKYVRKDKWEIFKEQCINIKQIWLAEKEFNLFLISNWINYQHYTECYINILAIIYNITNLAQFQKLEIYTNSSLFLNKFISTFSLYRCRLHGEFKQINKYHWGVLVNWVNVIPNLKTSNSNDKEEIDTWIESISNAINNMYLEKENKKLRLQDFLKTKLKNIDIHERIIYILSIITMNNPTNYSSFIRENNGVIKDLRGYVKNIKEHFEKYESNWKLVIKVLIETLITFRNFIEKGSAEFVKNFQYFLVNKCDCDWIVFFEDVKVIITKIVKAKPSSSDKNEVKKWEEIWDSFSELFNVEDGEEEEEEGEGTDANVE